MKRKLLRRGASLLAAVALASVPLVALPSTAAATESMPTLQWPAVDAASLEGSLVSAPDGSVTMPCSNYSSGGDLTTYSSSGQVVRQLDRTASVDGVKNCITSPAVDKNGDVYGIPYGTTSSGSYARGPNILAFDGNTLKWKYPSRCNSNNMQVVVGGDGNIYSTTQLSDGVHLIGLAPELEPGQTQPAKVFDVKLPSDCSIQLFPYRDGLMLRGQNSGLRYYSYTGQFISQPSVNRFWDAEINDRGHLFDIKYVSGSTTSASVARIDPVANQELWSVSASTPGANVQGLSVHPMANGSVVTISREQKMVSGVPATPTEYIYTLVVLNANGQKLHSVPLPNDQQNPERTYATIRAVATSDGKLAMLREMYIPTGLSYPTSVMGMRISVFDPVTGMFTYDQEMHGELSKPVGPQSYILEYSTEPSFVTANNTLAFVSKCTRGCNDARKLYAVQVADLGMDYPRGMTVNPVPRPSSAYVALGDSISSGEGNPQFEAGTDTTVNRCHRSAAAYPRLIAGSSSKIPPLDVGGFRACGGATTFHLGDAAPWNEGIQLDRQPDPNVELVTITIGGNDIGFGDLAEACVLLGTSCDVGSSAYNNTLNKINNELSGKLVAAYRKILRYAPNAKIFVLGYPQVIANKSVSDPGDSRCFYMQGGSSNWAEARATRGIVTMLNGKIDAAVTQVRSENSDNQRLTFVPLDGPTSPFIGHEVCGTASSSWFQNIDQATNDPAYVFHPNELGQEGYATVAGAAINNAA